MCTSDVHTAFVFDTHKLACMSARDVRALHSAVENLAGDLKQKLNATLHVAVGETAQFLADFPKEFDVVVAHTDPVHYEHDRRAVASFPNALWSDGLGPLDRASLASVSTDYREYVSSAGYEALVPAADTPQPAPDKLPSSSSTTPNETCMPTVDEVLAAWRDARQHLPGDVDEGSEIWLSEPIAGTAHALQLLKDAVELSSSSFQAKHLPLTLPASGGQPREHVAMARVLAAKALNRAEPITRVLQTQLAFGTISAREVRAALRAPIERELVPLLSWDESLATLEASVQQVEANEWHRRLAWHDLLQDSTGSTSRVKVHYWKWHGFYVRYTTIEPEAGRQSSSSAPVVCVHGFGASARQWDDLMEELATKGHTCYAVDLIGFGHAQKPPISYTQYLWEQLVCDFVKQVVCQPSYLAGNSIGGYTAMSAAASLGKKTCVGVILLNSAGRLITREEEAAERASRGGRTLAVAMAEDGADILEPLKPPPSWLLTAGGRALFAYLQPNIARICRQVYPNNPDAVDDSLTKNILRDSNDPGAVNVLTSGAKLPTPITKNELMEGYGGRVLVATGMNDPLGGGQAAKRYGMYLEVASEENGSLVRVPLEAGHCPHDEAPQEVAEAIHSFIRKVC